MRIRQFVHTSKREVYLVNFYLCGYLSFFGLFALISTSYSNPELTKAKWAGGLLGFLFSFIPYLMRTAFVFLFKISDGIGMTICLIVAFVLYTVFMVLFGVFKKHD